MGGRKIDIYNHVMPRTVADHMRELAPGKGDMVKRVTSIPMLHDIEARIRMMEEWPGYQQVLTLSNPPLETIAGPGDSPALARLANDELRRICAAGYCAALAVFCRIRSISPWIWPPWRWMTEANSERWVTAMLTPSTMTSLIL